MSTERVRTGGARPGDRPRARCLLNLLSVLSLGAGLALSACSSESEPAAKQGVADDPVITATDASVESQLQTGAAKQEPELDKPASLPQGAATEFEDAPPEEVARIGLDGDRAVGGPALPLEDSSQTRAGTRASTAWAARRNEAKPTRPRVAGLGAAAGDMNDDFGRASGGLSRNTPPAPKAEDKVSATPAKRPIPKPLDEDVQREVTKKSKSKAGGKSRPDAALADAQGLLTRLGQLEGELRNAGVPIPIDAWDAPGNAASGPGAGEKGDKGAEQAPVDCVQVCELSEAICDLEIRICALSRAHPEDDRYQNACERAGADCRAGSEVCNTCSVESE